MYKFKETHTESILNYFKKYPDVSISPIKIAEELNINYNTAAGTLNRLAIEGLLKKIGRGEFVYPVEDFECPECGTMLNIGATNCPECGVEFEEEFKCPKCGIIVDANLTTCPECKTNFELEYKKSHKGIVDKKKLPNPELIKQNIEKNIKTFKTKSENNRVRKIALENLRALSTTLRISDNQQILDLINTIHKVEKEFHSTLLGILIQIIAFENSNKGNKQLKEEIIEKCSDTIKKVTLSDNFEINIRISAWSLYREMKENSKEVIDTLFSIAKSDDYSWNQLGSASNQIVSKIRKSNNKKYFLEKLEALIRDSNDEIAQRAENIYKEVQNYYADFYLFE